MEIHGERRGRCGTAVVEAPDDADVLLLNVCPIRDKAQEKVFHQLGRWKPIKARRKGVLIGVGGCVSSQEGEAIVERAPPVGVVFGPQRCIASRRCSTRRGGKAPRPST